MNTDLFVRFVQGRYPAERRAFRSQNILVNITGLDGTRYRIRLDDESAPDAWLELIVELSTRHEAELAICGDTP